MKEKISFSKDFVLVVIGQIISLLGNGILRFALPLYLLTTTHSAALFGLVSALAFIPMILLCPIGGIVADRLNKRNVMVGLDILTGILTGGFLLFMGHMNLTVLILVTMTLLYGIQGAYQPVVQACVPGLVKEPALMPANAIINLVSSFSGLIGPVLGGAVFSFWGIYPILWICGVLFFLAAFLELFIHMPYKKRPASQGIWPMVKSDMKESYGFIRHDNPLVLKITMIVFFMNLLLSSIMIIGMPVIITQMLGFSAATGSRLYGISEGVLAAGGLAGGIAAGVLSKKLKAEKSYVLLILCSIMLFPMASALLIPMASYVAYSILVISSFAMMFSISLFSIQMITYAQAVTPAHLIGKIMSLVMSIGMCATPIGQVFYGFVFEHFRGYAWIAFGITGILCVFIAIKTRSSFRLMEKEISPCALVAEEAC